MIKGLGQGHTWSACQLVLEFRSFSYWMNNTYIVQVRATVVVSASFTQCSAQFSSKQLWQSSSIQSLQCMAGTTSLSRLAALIHVKSFLLSTLRPSTNQPRATSWKSGGLNKTFVYVKIQMKARNSVKMAAASLTSFLTANCTLTC